MILPLLQQVGHHDDVQGPGLDDLQVHTGHLQDGLAMPGHDTDQPPGADASPGGQL